MLKKSDITPSFLAFALTILASVGFFNYHDMLKDNHIRLLMLFFIFISAFLAYTQGRSLREVHCHEGIYLMMLGSMSFSVLMAYTQHGQPLVTSIIAVTPFIICYAYFFVMMKFDFDPDRIMRFYIFAAILSAIVYFINTATMPRNIFGKPILDVDTSRGIIRLPVVFIEMLPLLVFYAINKWIDTKKKKWFVLMGFASVMIFLSVTRQVIALTAVLGFWFMFRRISLLKKLLLVAGALAVVVYVLPMIPVYKTMIEFSEDQSEENDDVEDIRIQAWRFYTYENQENALTAIFGNGVPSAGNGLWGTLFDSEAEVTGMFTHDVGWAGYYFFFGIIATISLMLVLAYAILKPKPPQYQYLTYWLVFISITSVASGPILYYWQILGISVVLSMVYSSGVSAQQLKEKPLTEDKTETDTGDNLFNKYPQLENGNHKPQI